MGASRIEEKGIQNVEMRTGAPWRPHHASDLSRLFLIPSLLLPELWSTEQTSQTTLVWERLLGL